MIRLQCECGRRINAPDQYLGKRVKCPKCGKGILVGANGGRAPVADPTPTGNAVTFAAPSPFAESTPVTESPAPRSMPSAGTTHEDLVVSQRVTSGPDISTSELDDTESAAAELHFSEDSIRAEPPAASDKPREAPAAEAAPAPEEGREDPYRRRGISLLGLLAIVLGLAGAAMYFVPQVAKFFIFVAGAGAAIGLIGLILSIGRRRTRPILAVLGILVSAAAIGLYWLPLIRGDSQQQANQSNVHTGPPEVSEAARAADETRRRSFITVTFLEPTGSDSVVPDLEYKLTNKSGKDIKAFGGRIEIYDSAHNWLTNLGIGEIKPVAAGGVSHGKGTWPLDQHTLSLLKDRRVTTEYRADYISYADGTTERFLEP
jgi:hypothetical protein